MGEKGGGVRIVSLLPSATELIATLLLHPSHLARSVDGRAQLVGVSHECDYPFQLVGSLPKLTSSTIKFTTSQDVDRQVREHLDTGKGLYQVDAAELESVQPDVIVTQSLCRVCSVDYCLVERLAGGLNPVPTLVDTNPQSLAEVLGDLSRIGKAIGMEDVAACVTRDLKQRIDAVVNMRVKQLTPASQPLTVAVLEWTEPMFIAGHWTPQLVSLAGGLHPLNPASETTGAGKSITITSEQLVECNPDVLILAPCGLDLAQTTKEARLSLLQQTWWGELQAVQNGTTYFVDGNQMFNRPGPRLVNALEWLYCILHQDVYIEGVDAFPAVQLDQIDNI